MLTGAENAQKALLTFFENDNQGKPKGKWEIVVIDDKMKDGAHLPDASAANSEILFAMGQNPAMSGQGNTGGSYSGGANNGGSNIRESGLDLRSQLRADRDILFTYFGFIQLYNGMDPEVRSEEHTSELQSLMRISYAVFCLKKKKKTHTHDT